MRRVAMLFGGCGGRVGEALVFAACAGVLSVRELRLMLIDPDAEEPHRAHVLALLERYDRIRGLCAEEDMTAFQTRLSAESWPEHLPGGAATLRDWFREEEEDELLMQALFAPEAAGRDMRRGFGGDRALAGTVLRGLMKTGESEPEDALNRLLTELESGEDVQLVLVGSLCGGTGGAGIPAMAAYLRERLGEKAHLSAVLLLPYGALEEPAAAREALRDWTAEGLSMPVCLIGLPKGARLADGADEARLPEWLSVHALDWLLCHDASDHAAYTYRTEENGLTWQLFGREAEVYRDGYSRLMKTAALFRLGLREELLERLTHPSLLRDRRGWYGRFVAGSARTDEGRQAALKAVEDLCALLDGAWTWMEQTLATLPLQLHYAEALADALQAARENEFALAELAGQLDVLTREAEESGLQEETVIHRTGSEEESEAELAQRRLAVMRTRLRELIEAQPPLNRHAGGRETLEMLEKLLVQCRHEAEAVREQEKEARRRIDQAEAVATPQERHKILAARTKLKPMQRNLAMRDSCAARVQQDLEALKNDPLRWQAPVLTGEEKASQGLLSLEAMRLMRPVQEEERKGSRQRLQEAENAFASLLGEPDEQTVKRVMQALPKAEAGDTLAGLIAAVMTSVRRENA